jgi:hypothetical protein
MNDWQQDVADSRAVIRTQPDGPGPPTWIYGSEGWGFESLRVRQCFPFVKAFFPRSASVRIRCGRALGAIGRQQRLGHSSSSCALLAFDEMVIHVLCDGKARVS